jgi:hypothetical protein
MEFDWDDYLHRKEVCGMSTLTLPDGSSVHYQRLNNVTVIRDDLCCGGTKSRYLSRVLPKSYSSYLYVTSWWGGAQIALALAVQELNCVNPLHKRSAIIVTFDPKGPLPAHVRVAQEFGAKLILVPTKSWQDLHDVAENYIDDHPDTWLVPNGIDTPEAHREIKALGKAIRAELGQFDEVWSVAGSGCLTRGLQASGLGNDYYAVAVTGGIPDIGEAHGILHPQSFDERVDPADKPPFPSALHYDAKGWQYAWESAQQHPDRKILYWNVM